MKNKLSFSTSPLTRIINSNYFDLDKTLEVMLKLWNFSIIHGFEFQYLAEWNRRNPPEDDDPRYSRLNNWKDSLKYDVKEIGNKLNNLSVPILSIHGNRDIGLLLCSESRENLKNGRVLLKESASLAELLKAKLCVFHIWDTKSKTLNLSLLKETIYKISAEFPHLILSVENIPTSMPNFTPFELIKDFKWITLDLRWCALYDELKKFSKIKKKIANVHIRGELEDDQWKLKNSPFTVEEALELILKQWRYKGILTFEPEGGLSGANWENLLNAINAINEKYLK